MIGNIVRQVDTGRLAKVVDYFHILGFACIDDDGYAEIVWLDNGETAGYGIDEFYYNFEVIDDD